MARGGDSITAGRRADTTSHGGLTLRAGPLTAELLDGNLRWVRAGRTDLVQRIYVAVRDTAFNTVLPRVRVVDGSIGDDHFDIEILARHRDRDIEFTWSGFISGSVEGRISYRFDGKAGRSFEYNKIGLNVIHPTTTHAGARVEAAGGPDGPFRATLPRLVGPQAVRDGHIRGIVPPFRAISIYLDDGLLDLVFDGDDFEMEDERNWTETGFKSYSGPLSRPWPLVAERGMTIRQGDHPRVSRCRHARWRLGAVLHRLRGERQEAAAARSRRSRRWTAAKRGGGEAAAPHASGLHAGRPPLRRHR